MFNCESTLIDLDVNEQVSVSNDTITNIMSNFLPNKIISCENRDSPWMNCHIKYLILYKTNFYTTFIHGKNSMFHYLTFNNLQNYLDQLKKVPKKLSDPSNSSKFYWSLLKTLLNGKNIPCIPPIFHNNKYIVDFKEKSEIFNTFFAEQCFIIPYKSVLLSQSTLVTENSLANCHFSKKCIPRIMRNPVSNMAHGHDMISIRNVKTLR